MGIKSSKKSKINRKNRVQAKPVVVAEMDHERAVQVRLCREVASMPSVRLDQAQAGCLEENRLSRAQRLALATQIGQMQGNQCLQRALAPPRRDKGSRELEPATQQVLTVQKEGHQAERLRFEQQRIEERAAQLATESFFSAIDLDAIAKLPNLAATGMVEREHKSAHLKLASVLERITRPRAGFGQYQRSEGKDEPNGVVFKWEAKNAARYVRFQSIGLVRYEIHRRRSSKVRVIYLDARGKGLTKKENKLREHPEKLREKVITRTRKRALKRAKKEAQERVKEELSRAGMPVIEGRLDSGKPKGIGEIWEFSEYEQWKQRSKSPLKLALQQAFEEIRDPKTALAKGFQLDEELARGIADAESQRDHLGAEKQKLEAELLGLKAHRAGLLEEKAGLRGQLQQLKSKGRSLPDGVKRDLAATRDRIVVTKEEIAATRLAIKAMRGRIKKTKIQMRAANKELAKMKKQAEDFEQSKAHILESPDTATLARKSVGPLCFVISHFLYLKAIGALEPTKTFRDFYLDEVRRGIIAREPIIKKGKVVGYKTGIYYGARSGKWHKRFDLAHLGSRDVPLSEEDKQKFFDSGVNLAITHQDLKRTPPRRPHHWLLIVKDKDGFWRNMDHTSTRLESRGGITDFNRVYRIKYGQTTQWDVAKDKLNAVFETSPWLIPFMPLPLRKQVSQPGTRAIEEKAK